MSLSWMKSGKMAPRHYLMDRGCHTGLHIHRHQVERRTKAVYNLIRNGKRVSQFDTMQDARAACLALYQTARDQG
jgi:hypothetical protein